MGENVVVLWNVRPFLIKEDELRFPYEKREVAYYAIVGPDGKILREATRLPKFTILGRSDMPVEYKDSLYWVAGGLKGVRFVEFKPMMKGKK